MRFRSCCAALSYFLLILLGLLITEPCRLSFAQECCSEQSSNLPDSQSLDPDPTLEEEMLALTNQHRIRNGLQALVVDEALSQIAREHSSGMSQQGFISHSQPLGNLKVRMSRAGYHYEIARENVATAPTLQTAQNAFTESPAHESNILANDITRVGIGIARCPSPYGRQLYITEIFANPRKEYQPALVEQVLAGRVDELRQNGAGSMVLDPDLEKMASNSLLSISMPYKKEELQNLLTASANGLQDDGRQKLARLKANVQLLHNPRNLTIPNETRDGQALMYGAAIRQVTDSQNQAAYLVLTLIGFSN